MRENHVLTAWRNDEQTVGAWLSIASPYTAESLARAGFDWVCIDMQHGLLDYADVRAMLPAISPPDNTKSPSEISSSTCASIRRSSMPS